MQQYFKDPIYDCILPDILKDIKVNQSSNGV